MGIFSRKIALEDFSLFKKNMPNRNVEDVLLVEKFRNQNTEIFGIRIKGHKGGSSSMGVHYKLPGLTENVSYIVPKVAAFSEAHHIDNGRF